MNIEVRPFAGALGAEVIAADLARFEDDAQFACIEQALFAQLNEHATQPAFVYRHQWRLHDVLFWDNRCTIHLATGYDRAYTRHMHRTTIQGDRPF